MSTSGASTTETTRAEAGSRSGGRPPLYPVDPVHEARLTWWARGWDARSAEVAALRARIAALEAEADRLYLRAHNSPDEVEEIMQRRLDAAFEEIERAFSHPGTPGSC